MEKGKKLGIIIGGAVVLVIIAVVVFIMFGKKEDVYRIIKVYDIEGTTTVTKANKGALAAYINMVLESGDYIVVEDGKLTLKLDEDKYAYVEADSEFELQATGNAENSKTAIILKKGAVTNEIQNKLSDESSYEVNTPNSSMSVRGTVFRINTYIGEDGVQYTRVTVFQGEVDSKLIDGDGSMSDAGKLVPGGKEILIYQDDTNTDYVSDIADIDYTTLPPETIETLIQLMESGNLELDVSVEDLKSILQEEVTVTFKYNGSVFATQTVKNGELVQLPLLKPAASGGWDYDFTKPVTADTEINWK